MLTTRYVNHKFTSYLFLLCAKLCCISKHIKLWKVPSLPLFDSVTSLAIVVSLAFTATFLERMVYAYFHFFTTVSLLNLL